MDRPQKYISILGLVGAGRNIYQSSAGMAYEQKIRGTGVYRVIYFTPMVAAPAAVAMVWSWLYNTEFGALNQLLGNLGFQTHSWLNDPKYAMLSIVIIAIWGGMGQQIIILIVAITNVPKTYYEAAAIDGANGFVKLFKITVPLISPSVFFLTITGFIGSLTQFDLIYMLYGNNTSKAMDSVRTIMFQYYRRRLWYRINPMPPPFPLSPSV
ncbi:MAG: carbohydrate ABC transporter permease [Blautia marasmi]